MYELCIIFKNGVVREIYNKDKDFLYTAASDIHTGILLKKVTTLTQGDDILTLINPSKVAGVIVSKCPGNMYFIDNCGGDDL